MVYVPYYKTKKINKKVISINLITEIKGIILIIY